MVVLVSMKKARCAHTFSSCIAQPHLGVWSKEGALSRQKHRSSTVICNYVVRRFVEVAIRGAAEAAAAAGLHHGGHRQNGAGRPLTRRDQT